MICRSLQQWSEINGPLILFIFLPALIFEGSFSTNYYAWNKHFWGAIVRANSRPTNNRNEAK